MLSELGHPERVAAAYQPSRRHQIGPELFPLFKRVTRVEVPGGPDWQVWRRDANR